MKTLNRFSTLARIIFALTLLVVPSLRAGQFFQDFGGTSTGAATNFGDGSQLFSSHLGTVAQVVDSTYKELQLTASGAANVRTAFMLPDLDRGNLVLAFSAKWNSPVCGDYPDAGNGFSFNFGPLAPLNLIGAGYSQESGYPTGICFSVQTDAGNNPGFYLRINGDIVASQPFTPQTFWGINNPTRHFFEVDWNYSAGVTVQMDGQPIFSNVATPGFTPQAGNRFVWAARTGLLSEYVRLDNIAVVSGGNLKKVNAQSPYLGNGAASAFDGNAATYWSTNSSVGSFGATFAPTNRIAVYTLTSANYSNQATSSEDPATWRLEGSSNAVSWTSCGSGSGVFLNRFETRCWMATNTGVFTNYRLNVLQNQGNPNATAVAELQLYAFQPVAFYGWRRTTAPVQPWTSVDSSADGTKLVACSTTSGGGIYTSTNSGTTWTRTAAQDGEWEAVASSSDGMKLIAATRQVFTFIPPNETIQDFGTIFLSTNAGASWVQTSERATWRAVASSGDGNRLFASDFQIRTSTNSGQTWNDTFPAPAACTAIATSRDGNKVLSTFFNDTVQRSTNGGASWLQCSNIIGRWRCASSSADGTRLAVGSMHIAGVSSPGGDRVWYSTDSGENWTRSTAPADYWFGLTSTADGTRLWMVGNLGIWVSTDSGATWAQDPTAPQMGFWKIKASDDGSSVVAVQNAGNIWRYGALAPMAPTVTTLLPAEVTGTNAQLRSDVNPEFASTTTWFEWGTTTNYGNATAFQNVGSSGLTANVSGTATGLLPITTYHYRAVASNAFGVTYGADGTFTTLGGAPVIGLATARVGFGRALLSGNVNPNYFNTSVRFDYAPMGLNLTNSTPWLNIGNGGSAVNFSQTIDVTPGATYQFRVTASGYTSTNGNVVTFTAPTENDFIEITTSADPVQSSSTNSPAHYGADQATDNIVQTKYLNFDKTNTFLVLRPAFTNRIVRALTLISADDAPERDPASFVLEGSMDGLSFSRIASNAVPPFAGRTFVQVFPVAPANAFNFYRLQFPTVADPGAANAIQIAEVELLAHADFTSTNDIVSATASGSLWSTPEKLTDRRLYENEEKFAVQNNTSNVVVDITPAAGPMVLKGFELIGGNDSGLYAERHPTNLTVFGSQDGTNFAPLGAFLPGRPTADRQIEEFTVPGNITSYAHYRFNFGAQTSGIWWQIGELRLFGETARPMLRARASGGDILVSWPHVAGFNLESKTNFNQLMWIPVAGAPVLSNGVNTVTLPMSGAPIRFFQLRK